MMTTYIGPRTCRTCGADYVTICGHRSEAVHKYAMCVACRQIRRDEIKRIQWPKTVALPRMPDLSDGLCWGTSDDTWYPTDPPGRAAVSPGDALAISICQQCPVRDACLDWSLRAGETHGIWGGTTPRDRARLGSVG